MFKLLSMRNFALETVLVSYFGGLGFCKGEVKITDLEICRTKLSPLFIFARNSSCVQTSQPRVHN
jgi:hypothetical protein